MMKNENIKLDKEEKALLESVESGEWKSVKNLKKEKQVAKKIAGDTLKKDARINIRVPQIDLNRIKRIAAHEGLPYQTLISSVLHKYATGHLKNDRD